MKKLQSNFTTPEQSKRLLELGVPAWTADCYMLNHQIEHGWDYNDYEIYIDEFNLRGINYYENKTILPCWSVGRLIEIYKIADDDEYQWKWYFAICKDDDVEHPIVEDGEDGYVVMHTDRNECMNAAIKKGVELCGLT